MSSSRFMKPIAALALPALFGVVLACSTDSPTAPTQQPAPPPGSQPSTDWTITVTVDPEGLPAESTVPSSVSVDVRRADSGVAPPSGTTIVASTSLGEFDSAGSGLRSIALATVNGRAQTLLFPGSTIGTAVLTVRLENSAGQTTFEITAGLPDLVAAFSFENTTDNLSIQFINQSTGNPDRFHWDFGDGNTSTEKHPSHTYSIPGDYPVELTVFRGNEVAQVVLPVRAIAEVFVTSIEPRVVREGGRLRIGGQGFDNAVRVFINNLLTRLVTKSTTLLVVDVPVGFEFSTEQCDFNGDLVQDDGIMEIPLNEVTIRVEVSGSVSSDSFDVALEVLPEDYPRCQADPDFEPTDGFFITAIEPNAGPESGGSPVTISGTGFTSPLRVFFGDVLANTTSVSSTAITVTTPPFDVPDDVDCIPVNVKVELESGAEGSISGGFTYIKTGASCE